MIGRLDYIVNIYRLITHAYSICLIYIPCLIMTEPAALYMIGIVSEIHLYLMINATFNSIFSLLSAQSADPGSLLPQIDALVSAQNPVYSTSFPSEKPQESYHERSNF